MSGRGLGAGAAISVFVAVVGLLVLAAPAGAYIYWGNIVQGTIGRAENDGSSANPGFITGLGSVKSLAVDAGHIYWANEKEGKIGRANIDGTGANPNFITGIEDLTGVAVTPSWIYWSSEGAGYIGRAKIDGTGPQYQFINVDIPCGVAVDSGHLYWDEVHGSPAYIGRAGLEGSDVELTFIEIPGVNFPCGVAVDSANVFWLEPLSGRIGRANKVTGTGADPNYIGEASGPCGIARDSSSHILWANHGTGTIGRANADGTGVDQSFIAAGSPEQICGVAVDDLSSPPSPLSPPAPRPPSPSPTKPKASISNGPGKKLDQDIATFAFKADEKGSTFRCKLDSKKRVRCRSPKTYKRLKAGRHTFRVWAVDTAGDESTPAKRSFKVPG